MKTIGIDARFYGEAGPGRYVKAILQELEKQDTQSTYLVFLRDKGLELYQPQNPNFKKIKANYKWYSWNEQTLFLLQLLKHNLDVLYVPHFNIPILYPKTLITAIPDIIMHKFSTQHATTRSHLTYVIKKLAYYLAVLIAVIRSKFIIVPSKTVKKDFLDTYKFLNPQKLVVAPEGVDPKMLETPPAAEEFLTEFGIKQPFLLYISSMYKHKNVPALLEAFKLLKTRYGFSGQLVLIGKKDYFSTQLYETLQKDDMENKVIMPGMKRYITDAETNLLRQKAVLYVFPSLMEGFSLTPMEAQAFDLPAVISDIPCHREIYKDSVVYFDPNNPEDMAEKIWETLQNENLQNSLIERGRGLIKNYSWSKTAEITLEKLKNT